MNANRYAEVASRVTQFAEDMSNVPDNDSCLMEIKLAVYYLRSAAAKLRRVAETKAEREKTD